MPARVVFDTNVWVSGLIWKGAPYRCLAAARCGLVQAVTCEPLLSELSEKLLGKFGYPAADVEAIEADLRNIAVLVVVPQELQVIAADPDDDVVVECAVVAGADWIVSGDRHLQAMGSYDKIEILSPAELLLRL